MAVRWRQGSGKRALAFTRAPLHIVRMSNVATNPNTDVRLSASAAAQIKRILPKQPGAEYLRIAVDGGGCSGFSYRFDFADRRDDDDTLVERDGAGVVIDAVSLPFLEGSEIDYVQELIGAAFKVHNPNAVANCGCGTSFSI